MFLDGNYAQMRLYNAGFHRSHQSERQDGKQGAQSVWIGQMHGLQREALRFERLPNLVCRVRNWRGAAPYGWARFQFLP